MVDQDSHGHCRRRSVDVGGLALALGNQGLGHGWGGWDERELGEVRCVRSLRLRGFSYTSTTFGFRYAELLSDMYTQTQNTVNHYHIQL